MSRHTHFAASSTEGRYSGTERYSDGTSPGFDRAATGGERTVETCECGATRTTLRNGHHEDRGEWVTGGRPVGHHEDRGESIEWEKLDASQPIPKALGAIILPVVERWGRR